MIGVILSAPVLAEHLRVMFESSRVSGPDSLFAKLSSAPMFDMIDQAQLGTVIHRFFSSETLGSGSNYRGWSNILEAPTFYCGIPCMLLLPLLFGYLNNEKRKLFAILLAIWILPVVFPWFRHAFWLFAGDYYRAYSLFIAFIFIYYSVLCLDLLLKGKKTNLYVLIATAVVCIAIRKLSFFDEKNVLNEQLETVIDAFVIAYSALIFWMSRQKEKNIPMALFLVLLCVELAWFSSLSVNRGSNITVSEKNEKTGYNDYSVDAIAWLKANDKSFFRIDKNYGSSPAVNSSLNDGMVQDYYGTSSYNSFNQKYYLQYLRAYNVVGHDKEEDSRWSFGLVNRQFLENLNSARYFLQKDYKRHGRENIRDSMNTFGNITVFKLKFALPLGYCYRNYIKYSDFEKLRIFQKDIVSLRAAVVNDIDINMVKGLNEFHLKDTIDITRFNFEVYRHERDSLAQDTLTITSFTPEKITGRTNLKREKLLYLSIPFDDGWQIFVDGKEQKPILIANGMIGLLPGIGEHLVELIYKSPYRTAGYFLSLFGVALIGGLIIIGRHKRPRNTSNQLPDAENA